LIFALFITIWVVTDSKRRHRTLSFRFTALTFFLWLIIVPLYLYRTRGFRALLSLLGFA
jgi:hypothetical protein